jgi:rubrerythrin
MRAWFAVPSAAWRIVQLGRRDVCIPGDRRRPMTTREALERYRRNFQDEIDSAAQYRAMAEGEHDERTAAIYRELAGMEEKHASFWEERLRKANADVPARRPSWRARVLSLVARRLGAAAVLPTIATRE